MLADLAELTESAFTSAYTALGIYPLVPHAKLWLLPTYDRHVQCALTINSGFASRSRKSSFLEIGLISTQGHGAARDDHDERQVKWYEQ